MPFAGQDRTGCKLSADLWLSTQALLHQSSPLHSKNSLQSIFPDSVTTPCTAPPRLGLYQHMVCVYVWSVTSVISDSLWPYRLYPTSSSVHGFSRQEYWSGLPFPSPWYSLLKCINTWRGAHSLTIWWDCLHSVITAEPSVPHGQAQVGPWLAHSMIPEPKHSPGSLSSFGCLFMTFYQNTYWNHFWKYHEPSKYITSKIYFYVCIWFEFCHLRYKTFS